VAVVRGGTVEAEDEVKAEVEAVVLVGSIARFSI
jgi:hypothetical protein